MLYCETGKRSYRTNLEALRALANCQRAGRDETRYYKCEHCGNYHLTSKLYGVKKYFNAAQVLKKVDGRKTVSDAELYGINHLLSKNRKKTVVTRRKGLVRRRKEI